MGFIVEFVIAVLATAVVLWLFFNHRSTLFWKRIDYVYVIITIIGGTVAVANVSISHYTTELQQNATIKNETLDHLRDFVDTGNVECNRRNERRNEQRNAHIGGIINPFDHDQELDQNFKITPWEGLPWELTDLTEPECEFIKRVYDAVRNGKLETVLIQKYPLGAQGSWVGKKALVEIRSEIEKINSLSDRTGGLEENISSLYLFSILKICHLCCLDLASECDLPKHISTSKRNRKNNDVMRQRALLAKRP